MTLGTFLAILGIHLAAAMSPGPSFIVSIRVSAAEGMCSGAALALGFGIGAGLWAAGAMAGLALLFTLVPALYLALKIVGAALLFWIALMLWLHARDPVEGGSAAQPRGVWSAVRFGLVTYMTNPKPAIFFGAVFVGLVPTDTPLAWCAAIVAMIALDEALWYLAVARIFSLTRPRAAYLRLKVWLDRAFGAMIAGLGLKIALS